MSGACCARSACSTRGRGTRTARSTTRSCAPSRTTRSARPCGCKRTSGCARPRTASSAAPRGTWTSSTSSAAQGRAIGELGCTYLQFDDTSLAYLNDPEQREHVRSIGGDAEHQHETYIRHINEALEGRPEGMAVTTHMCKGNFRSSWVAQGGYDFVAEALFNELEVDGFFMECDDARSGGFEPLRFVPTGKVVVPAAATRDAGGAARRDRGG